MARSRVVSSSSLSAAMPVNVRDATFETLWLCCCSWAAPSLDARTLRGRRAQRKGSEEGSEDGRRASSLAAPWGWAGHCGRMRWQGEGPTCDTRRQRGGARRREGSHRCGGQLAQDASLLRAAGARIFGGAALPRRSRGRRGVGRRAIGRARLRRDRGAQHGEALTEPAALRSGGPALRRGVPGPCGLGRLVRVLVLLVPSRATNRHRTTSRGFVGARVRRWRRRVRATGC